MTASMQRTLIQIYEIQEPHEAEAVAALGVDRIGTVILSKEGWKAPILRETVRAVQGMEVQSGLIPLLSDRETIFRILDFYQPDFVHFCEVLSPFQGDRTAVMRQCDALISIQQAVKERFPADIMRSLSLPRPGAADGEKIMKNILSIANELAPVSDYFLLDTLRGAQTQPVNGFVGITGETCDWSIARAVVDSGFCPVILAGGLDGENVGEAILAVQPAGVDSCTRTNALAPDGRPIRFQKDLAKVKKMVEEVRRVDAG